MLTSFDDYLLLIPETNRKLIAALHEIILSSDHRITSGIKWSTPWYAFNGKGFAYLKSNRNHVNLGFPRGADLMVKGFDLEGTGKGMRHIKIAPDADLRKLPVKKLVKAALEIEKDAHR